MTYTFVILNVIFLLATTILCSIVIPILVQDEKTKKITKNFLLSLCVSDLLRVVLGCGFLIRSETGLKLRDSSCSYEIGLFGISVVASLLVTVVTTLNRFFAVCYPIKYQATMNERMSYAVIGGNWLLVLIIGSMFVVFQKPSDEVEQTIAENPGRSSCVFIQFLVHEEFLLAFSLAVIFPSIVVVVVTNILIYSAMKRVYTTNPNNRTSFIDWMKTYFDNEKGQGRERCGPLNRREIRATLIILFTVTNFTVIWTPVIVFRIVQVFGGVNQVTETLIYTIYTAIHTHSVINPFLYIFTIKHHKQAIRKLLARVLCCRTDEVATSNGNQMCSESS